MWWKFDENRDYVEQIHRGEAYGGDGVFEDTNCVAISITPYSGEMLFSLVHTDSTGYNTYGFRSDQAVWLGR